MATPELNKALAAFQAELPKISKDATGEIRGTTKDGKPYSYTFDYASLENVSDETLPALGRKGLALMGAINTDDEGRIVYDYWLLHESGEERGPFRIPLWLLLPAKFTAQTIGGYVSYGRRYAIGPVTGVAPGGQDIDAHGAEEAAGSGGRWMNRRPDVPPKALQDKRTPTRTTGAEQEQLRGGTVEAAPGDRPAKRARGQAPEGDPWLDQPPGEFDAASVQPEDKPGSADSKQLRDIHTRLTRLGYTDRDRGLKVIEEIVSGPLDGPHHAEDGTVRTSKNLSWQEAKRVVAELDARIKAASAAAEASAP